MAKRIMQIGLGRFGINHYRVLRRLESEGKVEIASISDVRPKEQIAKVLDSKYGTLFDHVSMHPYFTDFRDAIRRVDLVDIVTPASTHYEIAKTCLNEGKDVFVEKPLATSYSECESLLELAKTKKARVSAGHIFRYDRTLSEVKKLISEGALGDMHIIRVEFESATEARSDVGALLNYLHVLDILDMLLEVKPSKYRYFTYRKGDYEDYAVALLQYGDVLGRIEVSWLFAPKRRHISIYGTKMNLDAELESFPKPSAIALYAPKSTEPDKVITIAQKEEPLYLELSDFVAGRAGVSGDIGARIVGIGEEIISKGAEEL